MRLLAIFGIGFFLRLALIARFPLIFGGDPMLRMLHRDRVLISHQLPLLQLLIWGTSLVSHNYLVILVLMAMIGAAVGPALYLLARDLVDEPSAFWAGVLAATNPFLVGYSIVPFQESLMLACLLLAFHFFYSSRPWPSSGWLAAACFTRFEAWAAAPVLAWFGKRYPWPIRLLIYGWAPAAWLIYQRGLAPAGSYVIEPRFTLARLMRWVYLGYISVKFTPVIVLALGMIGFVLVWRKPRFRPLIAFVALFTIALLFSAHGDWPDPERRIAAREAHLWIAALLILTGLALSRFPRYRVWLATAGAIFGIWGSYRFVANEAADPRLQLAYRTARFFDRALQPGERVSIVSPPWPSQPFDFYLQRARETGGEAGYQAALRNLAEADTSPPDYQRTLIHSRFGRDRLLTNAQTCTDWIALWSDAAPPQLAPPPPVTVLRSGDVSVSISRRNCPR